MGYMQEIIRRGNVKYFISQKQEDLNKPGDDVGDIGAGSAWYVQEERPIYEQAVMSNMYRTIPDQYPGSNSSLPQNLEKYSDVWFSHMYSVKSNQKYNQLMGGNVDFESVSSLFKPSWYGAGWYLFQSKSNLSMSLGILMLQNYSKQELINNYCLSYPDANFLDLQGYRTGNPFYIQAEPYNDMMQYISLLDKELSTKKAKLGIRLDKEKRTFFFGIKGKAYLPQNMQYFFSPVFNASNDSSSASTIGQHKYFTYPKNYFSKLKEIFSDQKVKILDQAFYGLDHGLYRSYDEVPQDRKKISIAPWTFSNVESASYSFVGVGGSVMNTQWAKDPDGNNFYSSNSNVLQPSIIEELDLSTFNTNKAIGMHGIFRGNSSVNQNRLKKIFTSQNFIVDQVTQSEEMFALRKGLIGGAGTTWSSSNPTNKTYAHWDEGRSNPGYFWNPNIMDPLVLAPGPQFNQAWLAAVNAAAQAADADGDASIQRPSGEFNFIAMFDKPANLLTLSNNDVKDSGDGEAYIGYTYNENDKTFKVYLVSDNIGENNIKANPNCKDMFALDDTIKGSLTMNIEWLNTSQVTNMENMFGYKGV